MKTLDTATLPRAERADAVTTLMREIALASRVLHDDVDDVHMASWTWRLGPVELVHNRKSGMFMDVSRERDDRPRVLAIMLGGPSGGAREQLGHTIEARSGVVDMIELNRPHRSWIAASDDGWCVKVPVDSLALSPRTVTRARLGMSSSPLQHVFAQHLVALARQAPALADDVSASHLGTATVALARALVASAGDDATCARDALHDALVLRIQAFVHDHLTDHDLTPEAIASAHHISVRQLYKVCAESGIQLEQFILDRRLDGARWELTSPRAAHRSIASVAHQWGFSSPSHFNRRFRDKYAMTPGELRRRSAGPDPTASSSASAHG